MARDASDVTLCVLNYNGREFLEVVLPSIFAQTATGFAVHVLDNASTDGSLEYLAEHWPRVTVFPSAENIGVTRNMERAIQSAQTPYIAILNNDLELDPGWLEAMVSELEAHPEAAAVDGKMLQFQRRDHVDGTGDMIGRDGYPYRRGNGEPDRGQYEEPCEVFTVSGGAGLYRRSAFELVGPYDGDLGAYYEDVDWGFRARLRGLTNRYTPRAISYHMGSATNRREPGGYAEVIVRNQVVVLLKDMPGELLARLAPRIIWFEAKWLAFDILHGRAVPHVKGLWGALKMLPATLRKRREVQRTRTVPVAEIERVLG